MKRLLFIAFLMISPALTAQILERDTVKMRYNADSVRAEMDKAPYFTLFRDSYFIGGVPLNEKPTGYNSDVKFQLSISQRLTKSKLPFDTYLFITFTQKAMWNVFRKSMPMRDLNYNPGVGLGHLMIRKNKFVGKAYLLLEHESNGRDSLDSRSWNRVTLATCFSLDKNWSTQLKTWIPIIDSDHNRDIQKYYGCFQGVVNYRSDNEQFNASAIIYVRQKKNLSLNTQIELSYKFNNRDNQFFFLQYFNGYGENLLEYNQYKSILRLGFVIKPEGMSFF